jgi:DNA-binding transcriptional regulator/RsmH inhibitor MraZ
VFAALAGAEAIDEKKRLMAPSILKSAASSQYVAVVTEFTSVMLMKD